MKFLKVGGQRYEVKRSTRKNKKYMVNIDSSDGEQFVHFGAKGYRIKPGTKAGDSYCARSSGINGTQDITSPNFWSREMWRCRGKKSLK